MNRFLVSIVIFAIAQTQTLLRLSTNQTARLQVDQTITSTLGLFQATLRKSNCSLQIQTWNNSYVTIGTYTVSTVKNDCSYLQVQQGRLVTSFNQNFMYIGSSFNQSTIFTIDDLGVLRLIGTYIKSNRVDQQSFEVNVTTYTIKQQYIYSASQLNVKFPDSFGPLTNSNGWTYQASFGQLDMYFNENPNLTKSYVYSAFKFNNSQIQDFNSDTFPASIFSNITFMPRCFQPRIYLDFKAPFVIVADPFWPKVTVFEQGGYKVFQINYGQRSDLQTQQYKKDIHYMSTFSVCPDQTFQFKGKCLTSCPAPYFHQMRGGAGLCRLVCEQFSPVNLTTRVCSCMGSEESSLYNSEIITACPANSQRYPYGCVCTGNGSYFDKKYTYSCVTSCPDTTFGYGGLCMKCPSDCISCGIDAFHRMFLECKQCQTGYELNDGQCVRSCNNYLGNTFSNGTCLKCSDQNCFNCSINPAICQQCSLLWTLSAGSCFQSCPNSTLPVSSQFFHSKCLPTSSICTDYFTNYYKSKPFLKCDACNNNQISHLDGCVSACPVNYKRYSYQGYDYCSCQVGVTIDTQCLNISGCPIKMYYDVYSDSCLSCPFGCITCKGSSVCTSCYPGYFLYISPQAIICRRESPLFACNGQYALFNGICLVTDYANLQMAQCIGNVPNCKVCPYNPDSRTSVCVACNLGFYLYNNSCMANCPNGFISYQKSTCVLTQIQNCTIPYLESIHRSALINITLLQNSKSYQYYINNGIEPANDPVGYIPYFQQITSSQRKTDNLFRETNFFEPRWICLKCNYGYGMSDEFTQCLPCPNPCKTCYMAKNYSCLTTNTGNGSSCQGYVDYITKQCLVSCNSLNSLPELQNGILYCKNSGSSSVADYNRVDSAMYTQPDQTNIVYYIFQNRVASVTNVSVKINKPLRSILNASRFLQATNFIQKVVQVQDGQFFQVITAADQQAVIANFTNSIYKLQSVQGYYPPNLVYGSTTLNTHPEFMKTWLAVIGQIMAPVIIVMHLIYVGNDLLYKMDNLIILTQTIYYFSFVKILIGKLLAQFYYGWIFAHCGWFPNFFSTPNNYRENQAPISYKLATTDANFIRNAGYSISIFLVFIGGWAICTFGCFLISKFMHKKQVWHPSIAKNSLLAAIQFFSMNIMYWAIAQFQYNGDCQSCDDAYNKGSLVWAIIFCTLIIGYTFVRFFFNLIGGIYMVKRILIAIVLPSAFNDLRFIAPILILQIIFVIARFLVQRPQLKKEKLYILIQFGALLLVYLLLFICNNAGVNTIIISIVVFIFTVALMSDFMNLYIQSRNQWEMEVDNRQEEVKSGLQRAHTDQNLKPNSQLRQMRRQSKLRESKY